MEDVENVELYDLNRVEENLACDDLRASDPEAVMPSSAEGFMVFSASGFMVF